MCFVKMCFVTASAAGPFYRLPHACQGEFSAKSWPWKFGCVHMCFLFQKRRGIQNIEWLSSLLVSGEIMPRVDTTRIQCVHELDKYCEPWIECVVLSGHIMDH